MPISAEITYNPQKNLHIETVLAMLDKHGKNVTAKVYTRNISRQLSLDFEKHNAQYTPIEAEI